MTTSGIVVGYDGSPAAEAAVLWASREASARDEELTVALAGDVLTRAERAAGTPDISAEILRRGIDIARRQIPSPTVHGVVRDLPPDRLLATLCQGASLLVLGVEHGGSVLGRLSGWVGHRTVERVSCPVVLVPASYLNAPADPGGLVVAAVAAHRAGPDVIEFAMEHAEARHARVIALHAGDLNAGKDAARIADLLRAARERHPGVQLELSSVSQVSAAVRMAAAVADLLVIGARHRAPHHGGSRLGPVARRLVYGLPVPVAVISVATVEPARPAAVTSDGPSR